MNAMEVLAEAKRVGLVLRAEGGEVRYWPRGAMPALLAEWIRSMKAEILELLASGAARELPPIPAAGGYDRRTTSRRDAGIACDCGGRVLKDVSPRGGTCEQGTCEACGKTIELPPF